MIKDNRRFASKKAKVMLFFPPVFEPFQPYLSLPSLAAFLKREGIEVIQKDINIEAYESFLNENVLKKSYVGGLKKIIELEKKKKLTPKEQRLLSILLYVIKNAPYVIRNIESAKNMLRDKYKFYDMKKYQESRRIITLGMKLLSSEYYPTDFSLKEYLMKYRFRSTEDIIKAIYDKKANIFIDYFTEQVVPQVLFQRPNLIGISVVGDFQIIPAFTLARLIKEKMPQVHITIGGPIFTLLIDELKNNNDLFSIVDSFIAYEGETPLLKLAERIIDKQNLNSVPNLIYRKQGKIYFNNCFTVEDINSLPTPCYDGLPLNLYLSPELILSIQPARGCYWRKCAFCNNSQTSKGYRVRKTKHLIEDIRFLMNRYKTRYFVFVNDSITIKQLRRLSSSIIKNNLKIKWYCGMRFEENFTPQFCKLIKKTGCQKILFGLESACQRVLNLMEKGYRKEIIRVILNYCYKEKIGVHLYCLVGFPTETTEEAGETLNFVLKNKKILNQLGFSYTISTFQLKKKSKISEIPEHYLVRIVPEKTFDLSFMYRYKAKKGMSMEEAWGMSSRIKDRLDNSFRNILPRTPIVHTFLFCADKHKIKR